MNGVEFLKSVKRKYPDLPFLLITAESNGELAARAREAGAYDYLTKPFALSRLADASTECTPAMKPGKSHSAKSGLRSETAASHLRYGQKPLLA